MARSALKSAIKNLNSAQSVSSQVSRPLENPSVSSPEAQGFQSFQFEVVGEKFHQENFSTLRKMLKKVKGEEVVVEALMHCDPTNPYSESGKAVEILIQDLRVGYVPEYLASLVFDDLKSTGGVRRVKARVYFDSRAKWQERNSATLSYVLPEAKTKIESRSPEAIAKSESRKAANLLKRNEATARHSSLFQVQMASERFFPTLQEGSTICFSNGIEFSEKQRYEQKAIRNKLRIPLRPGVDCNLFVVEDAYEFDWQAESAVRNGVPIALFGEYKKHYKHLSLPDPVEKLEPPSPTISFASDTHFGVSPRPLKMNPVRLPQQTLAKYPTFTDYGSFNFRLVKLERARIMKLFEATNGLLTDGLVLVGEILETKNEQAADELIFYFNGEALGSVPKNEMNSYRDSYRSWRSHPVRLLVLWDFNGNLSAVHDLGHISAYKI